MDESFKSEITQLQTEILKAIQSHKICYDKIREGGGDDSTLKEELSNIQKVLNACQERQSSLLKVLKEKNSKTTFKFKVYDPPPSANKTNRRRRKDLSLTTKTEKKITPQPVISEEPPSPEKKEEFSSPESSSSSESDEETELSQSSMPVPLPMARPRLLPNGKEAFPYSRHGFHAKQLVRRVKTPLKISDEELCKDIPFIEDPPPSPEPANEEEAKIKFMAALNLLPTEMLPDILSKKTERKRRSTAHPSFVYNDDWDVPQLKKKNRQYLSPVKKQSPTNDKNKNEKPKVKDEKVGSIEKKTLFTDDDSSSQPEKKQICKSCGGTEAMLDCQDCGDVFHAKCPSVALVDQSFLLCIRCRRAKRGSIDSEESDSRQKSDNPLDVNGQIKLREKLASALCSRMEEKHLLESRVLRLVESLAVQSKLRKDLIDEEDELLMKISVLRKFIETYQAAGKKAAEEKAALSVASSRSSSPHDTIDAMQVTDTYGTTEDYRDVLGTNIDSTENSLSSQKDSLIIDISRGDLTEFH